MDGNVALAHQRAPTLLEQTNPVLIIDEATVIANALADIIEQKKLYTVIKKKKHVHVEGWTTLGALLKVFPILETSKRLDRKTDEIIYESRITAKTLDGKVVGIGEAVCSDKEIVKRKDGSTYQKWDDEYAVKSMSITRATSKSLRIPLGWIMVLAGYDGTPAEEMDGVKNKDGFGSGPAHTTKNKPKSAKPKSATIKQDDGSELETPNTDIETPEVPLSELVAPASKEFGHFIDSKTNADKLTPKWFKNESKAFYKAGNITKNEYDTITQIVEVYEKKTQ